MTEHLVHSNTPILKLIERLGLNGTLKALFFGQSRGNKVEFKGKRIVVAHDKKNVLRFFENQSRYLEELKERRGRYFEKYCKKIG